jgi:hypothetical protein
MANRDHRLYYKGIIIKCGVGTPPTVAKPGRAPPSQRREPTYVCQRSTACCCKLPRVQVGRGQSSPRAFVTADGSSELQDGSSELQLRRRNAAPSPPADGLHVHGLQRNHAHLPRGQQLASSVGPSQLPLDSAQTCGLCRSPRPWRRTCCSTLGGEPTPAGCPSLVCSQCARWQPGAHQELFSAGC